MQENDKQFIKDFINDNYDNLDNFFMAALLPMATSLSPINVVLVVQVVVKMKNTLVVITITLWNFIQLDSEWKKACKTQYL